MFVLFLSVARSVARSAWPCLCPLGALPLCCPVSFSAALSCVLTKLSILTCFPFPALPGFQKAPFAREAHRFFKNYGPHFWPEGHHFGLEGRFARKNCMFFAGQFLVLFLEEPSYSCKSLQKTCGCAHPSFWLPRATFKATTQNTAFCRDWRSVGGPFWPK